MTEDRFWKMIEDAHDSGDAIAYLSATLMASSRHEIISFNDILSQKIADAATFPILAGNFVIMSYVSDDTFRDFRAWLVYQGRGRYAAAIKDPETIADWLEYDEVDDIDGESMLMLAHKSYHAHGSDKEFHDQILYVPDPKMDVTWPENKTEYRERFPRLVDKYWNQERIKELHSD